MNRILLGWNVVLTVFLVALSVMLVQTADKVGDLEGELHQQVKYIEDEFVQEDDFYEVGDNKFSHTEELTENQYQSDLSAIRDELRQLKVSVAYFLEQEN